MSNMRFEGRPATHATRVATTVAAGALAMTLVNPQSATGDAGPTLLNSVQLLSGSSDMQTAIDQLLDVQQQVAGNVSQDSPITPFLTSYDLTRLPAYMQNLAMTTLGEQLNADAVTQFNGQSLTNVPFSWASATGTEPQPFLLYTNPDNQYHFIALEPNETDTITVNPAPGTEDLTFSPYSGNGLETDFSPLPNIDLADATPNPDGTYTITLSSTQPPDTPSGNWVDTAGAQTVLIRDTTGDWGLPHDLLTIQQDGDSAGPTLPLLSDGQITSALNSVAANMPHLAENPHGTYMGQGVALGSEPDNTFTPLLNTTGQAPGIDLPTQISSFGHFALQPDEALIVKVPDVDAAYSGLQLADEYGENLPSAVVQGSLNNTQVFQGSDGFTDYVISSEDPGVANWVDDSGVEDGNVLLRWQDVTGTVPASPIQTEVVPVADVRDDLPSDFPVVTAAERATDVQERMFEYFYDQHQDNGLYWLMSNLMYDQVKNAVGTGQFDAVFGSQQDVPSVLDRLTDVALIPSMTSVSQAVLSDPTGSLSALMDNLPLAEKDIYLPSALAALRMELVVEQTAQAVQSDISSGDLSQLFTEFGTGVQGLGTVFDQMWTDPATSITAGILNARDDLAVALMNAGSYSQSPGDFTSYLSGSLSELSQLVQSVSPMLSDPTDIISSLGAVLAP